MIRLTKNSVLFPVMLFFAGVLALGAAGAQGVKEIRAPLEAGRLEISQIEAALQRETLDDKRLADLRARLEPIVHAVDEIIQREQPRADEIKARIEKLGPAPDAAKSETESADVSKDRTEQQQRWREADETLRLSRALALRIDQMKEAIADRRRQNFTRQILLQGASLASPLLWIDVSKAMPGDFRAFRFLMLQWAETILANLQWFEMIVLALLAFIAFAGIPRARQWVRSGSFGFAEGDEPGAPLSRFGKALVALRMVLLNAIAPAGIFYLVYWLFQSFALLPGRADPVMEAMATGAAFVFGMSGLAAGLLSPKRPERRLLDVPDSMAIEFWHMIRAAALVVAVGKVFDTMQAAIVASLPLTVATKGIFAVLFAGIVARGLKRAFRAEPGVGEEPEPRATSSLLPLRLTLFGATFAIFLSALLGYVSLAGFLVNQVIWLTILGLVALLILVFVEEVLAIGLSSKGVFGSRVREMTGLTAGSLDQVSVLGAGLARLVLIVALAMLALAPWGLDSSNLVGNLKAAFFGFQVGGITISLSNIAAALVLFAVGVVATRAIQNWLDTNYLPHTGLDLGLRNSIRTIFGYVGVIIAAMVALAHLGVSLEKLTLVAGALSVGIGFGLKSIVENFVSGLILLWERPIRVGDWIVIGTEQGTVKRINVRATEIQTFDRASLIIPNAEFISGRVKNWMHADRTGRIIIPVNVDYQADPAEVEKLLTDAALAHREVMSEPPPSVIFKNLGESGLDFELRCFVDVDSMATTRSDLLYDIFRRLREARIDIPYPTRRLEITNLPAGGFPNSGINATDAALAGEAGQKGPA
ncbi:MAG: mechanosensitive ion channel [Beijerinckiaceae bacterium]|nr:MAG: mechanosensitive ion channel [Beijerinckiaceae bacterium]